MFILAEANDPVDVVNVRVRGLAWGKEIVEVEAIAGAVAFAVVTPTNEITEAKKIVTAEIERIFLNIKVPLNTMSLLDATGAKSKLLTENKFLYPPIMSRK